MEYICDCAGGNNVKIIGSISEKISDSILEFLFKYNDYT